MGGQDDIYTSGLYTVGKAVKWFTSNYLKGGLLKNFIYLIAVTEYLQDSSLKLHYTHLKARVRAINIYSLYRASCRNQENISYKDIS